MNEVVNPDTVYLEQLFTMWLYIFILCFGGLLLRPLPLMVERGMLPSLKEMGLAL